MEQVNVAVRAVDTESRAGPWSEDHFLDCSSLNRDFLPYRVPTKF